MSATGENFPEKIKITQNFVKRCKIVVAEHLIHSQIKPLLKVYVKYTTKAYFYILISFVRGVPPPTFLAAGCRRTTITLPKKKLTSL